MMPFFFIVSLAMDPSKRILGAILPGQALPVYTMRILGLGFVEACSFPDPNRFIC